MLLFPIFFSFIFSFLFFLLCHSQWNEMCHQHAHPLYTPEQTIESGQNKRFYSCVCLCLCQETLSPCVVHAVGYMLHAPSEQKTFFFFFRASLGTHSNRARRTWWFCCWPPFPKELLAKHLHIPVPVNQYQYQSCFVHESFLLSLSCSIHEWLGIL